MFKKSFALLLLLFIFCGIRNNAECAAGEEIFSDKTRLDFPFLKGERLIYDVNYNNLKIGESVLIFNGEKELNGEKVYHITFSTDLGAFKDVEDIYADKETFLPLKVSRRISQIGRFSYNVNEEYDQENFKVEIHKEGKLLSKEFTIKKDAPISNAILLPYYYRQQPDYCEKKKLEVILPTVNFDVVFKGKETIDTYLGQHSAYSFASIPAKFAFWLSTDKRRIPLKIKSSINPDYSLTIRSIEKAF